MSSAESSCQVNGVIVAIVIAGVVVVVVVRGAWW